MYKICYDKLTNQIACIIRTKDNVGIPCDEANTDYQAYLAWVAEGNEAQPWE